MLMRLLAVSFILAGIGVSPLHAATRCKFSKVADLLITMSGRRPTISAKINGAEARFILDSGAFYSMISDAAAAQYNLKPRPAPLGFRVSGIGGAQGGETRRRRARHARRDRCGLFGGNRPRHGQNLHSALCELQDRRNGRNQEHAIAHGRYRFRHDRYVDRGGFFSIASNIRREQPAYAARRPPPTRPPERSRPMPRRCSVVARHSPAGAILLTPSRI